MSFTYRHPISGSEIVEENPLLPEHIEEGRLLWYSGVTSISGWNCPAIITRVDKKKKRFWVRSLDDMREQDQNYDFTCSQGSPTSRKTMRLATKEEVQEYLQNRHQDLVAAVDQAKRIAASSKENLDRFNEMRAEIPI